MMGRLGIDLGDKIKAGQAKAKVSQVKLADRLSGELKSELAAVRGEQR